MPLIEVVSNEYKKLPGAPGKSLNVSVSGIGGKAYDCELYSVPGIISRPHPGMIGIDAKVGDAKIIIATHNYSLETDIETGDTMVYSTDSNGAKQARIILQNDGKFIFESDIDTLKGIINDLIATTKAIITEGSPVIHTVSGASKAALDVVDGRVNDFFGA